MIRRTYLEDVADMQSPSFECTAPSLDDQSSAQNRCPDPETPHGRRLDDDSLGIDEGDIDRKSHPHRVDPAAPIDHERPVEVASTDEAVSSLPLRHGNLGAGQDSTCTHEPPVRRISPSRIRRRRTHDRNGPSDDCQTLKRNSITSPSTG